MSGAVGGLPPIPAYLSFTKNESATATRIEAGDARTQAALKHFNTAAATIKTPQQLLGDYQSLKVVLGAFGMSSSIGQTAIIRDLLTQDPKSKTSLAQTSGNALWLRFAQQMSGWTASSTPLSSATARSTIASQFTENAFETDEGNAIPGMQQALYFTRTVGSDNGSLSAVMSDPTQLNVVETVLGLDPDQFGALDFDQQQAILKKDVKFSSFSSAPSIQRYAEQYLALTALNPPSATATYSLGTLFEGAGSNSNSLLGIIGASFSGAF